MVLTTTKPHILDAGPEPAGKGQELGKGEEICSRDSAGGKRVITVTMVMALSLL
jgi:hypothetical protein